MSRLILLISLIFSLISSADLQSGSQVLIPETSSSLYSERSARFPSLREFVPTIENGNANQLVGVYVDETLALRVVQQPSSNPGFVSNEPDTVTEFAMASNYGTTGLLAHNTAAGDYFGDILGGQKIVLVFGDGDLEFFRVKQIRQFQALSPSSPYSNFIDLATPGRSISVENLFYQIYQGDGNLVMQTCIERNGDPSWGRLFIIAQPVSALEIVKGELRVSRSASVIN